MPIVNVLKPGQFAVGLGEKLAITDEKATVKSLGNSTYQVDISFVMTAEEENTAPTGDKSFTKAGSYSVFSQGDFWKIVDVKNEARNTYDGTTVYFDLRLATENPKGQKGG